jgi:hypothetical protein
MVHGK